MCDALQVPWLFDNNASDFNLLKLVNTPMATSVLYSGGGSAAKRKAEKSTPPNPKRTKKGTGKGKGKGAGKGGNGESSQKKFSDITKESFTATVAPTSGEGSAMPELSETIENGHDEVAVVPGNGAQDRLECDRVVGMEVLDIVDCNYN